MPIIEVFLITGTQMFSKLLNPVFIIHMKDKPTSIKGKQTWWEDERACIVM